LSRTWRLRLLLFLGQQRRGEYQDYAQGSPKQG
jgi:hypothetical protein